MITAVCWTRRGGGRGSVGNPCNFRRSILGCIDAESAKEQALLISKSSRHSTEEKAALLRKLDTWMVRGPARMDPKR